MGPLTPALRLFGTLLILSGILIKALETLLIEVNGIVGDSALLSFAGLPDDHVDYVSWKFGLSMDLLGHSYGTNVKPYNGSLPTHGQLIRRLNMYNKTTLRIKNLTKSDGGVFRADVQLSNGSSKYISIQLNIFDPVPVPHINNESCNTTEGCRVRLHCLVPDGSDLKFTWYVRDSKGSGPYEHIANGSILYSNTSCSEYLCVVSNPADQKNTSLSLECLEGTQQDTRIRVYVAIAIIPVIAIALGVAVIIIYKRKKESQINNEAVPPVNHPDVGYEPAARTEDAVYANGISGAPNGILQAQSPSENSEETFPEEERVYLKVH